MERGREVDMMRRAMMWRAGVYWNWKFFKVSGEGCEDETRLLFIFC